MTRQLPPPENSTYIDPLLLYDLNGDGLSEIILPAKNLVYRRNRDGSYDSRSWGPLKGADMRGRAFLRIMPLPGLLPGDQTN